MWQCQLISKLQERSAVIAIIGMGYVGLPSMLRFNEEGYRVIGIDVDQHKISRVNREESYIQHISAEAIARAIRRGFEVTADTGVARCMGWMCQRVERLPARSETAHCTACGKTYSIEREAWRAAG